jgi:hypothetical protein
MKLPIPCIVVDRIVFARDDLYLNSGGKSELTRVLARLGGGE